MSDPSKTKTLLSLAGADLSPAKLSDATIVAIDCQLEYVDGALPLTEVNAAMEQIQLLFKRARAANTPIVHIAHRGQPGGLFDRDASNGKIDPRCAPQSNEPVIEKTLPNAFANTNLHNKLQDIGRPELIVVGFMTHMCVSSTVRAALDLGYRSTVIASACATRALPAPGGGIIDGPTVHQASLTALSDRFAVIATSIEDVKDAC